MVLCGISRCFHLLSPCLGQIVHALLTRPPLELQLPSRRISTIIPARLACVKHAASVRPEPGSNSYVQSFSHLKLSPESARQSQSPFQPSMSVSLSQNLTVSCTMISLCIVFKDRGALCSLAQRKSYYSKEALVCQAIFWYFHHSFTILYLSCVLHGVRLAYLRMKSRA